MTHGPGCVECERFARRELATRIRKIGPLYLGTIHRAGRLRFWTLARTQTRVAHKLDRQRWEIAHR